MINEKALSPTPTITYRRIFLWFSQTN